MDTVKANLRSTLSRLDKLGAGGGMIAIHVSAALAAAEGDSPWTAPTFAEVERTLWPETVEKVPPAT